MHVCTKNTIFVGHKQRDIMGTLKNTSGSKKVGIRFNPNHNKFVARFIQISNCGTHNQEDLIEMKMYKSEKSATKWAKKQLEII